MFNVENQFRGQSPEERGNGLTRGHPSIPPLAVLRAGGDAETRSLNQNQGHESRRPEKHRGGAGDLNRKSGQLGARPLTLTPLDRPRRGGRIEKKVQRPTSNGREQFRVQSSGGKGRDQDKVQSPNNKGDGRKSLQSGVIPGQREEEVQPPDAEKGGPRDAGGPEEQDRLTWRRGDGVTRGIRLSFRKSHEVQRDYPESRVIV